MGLLSAAFLVVAVVDFAVLVWALRLYRAYPSQAQWLATVPFGLLWYDNAVIGLGSTVGQGELLENLNTLRFLAHYTFLPFAIVALAAIARQAGFRWAQPWYFMAGFASLASYFMLDDLFLFKNADFYPSCFADTLRYTTSVKDYTACSPDAPIGAGRGIPPTPALTLSNLQILFGAYLWWKVGFRWLFIVSVGVLVLFAIPYSATGGIFSNIGEPIISGMLVVTAAWVTRNRERWQGQLGGGRVVMNPAARAGARGG